MRYIDNKDGTITDTKTDLMWTQGTMVQCVWYDAFNLCKDLNLVGHTDWRLPTIKELISIIDYAKYNPACDPIFEAELSDYWSSSTVEAVMSFGWYVHFGYGFVNLSDKTHEHYVRAVRNTGGSA